MRTTTPRRGLSGEWGTRLTRVRVEKGIPSAYGAAHLDSHTSWRISWQGLFSLFPVWICSTTMGCYWRSFSEPQVPAPSNLDVSLILRIWYHGLLVFDLRNHAVDVFPLVMLGIITCSVVSIRPSQWMLQTSARQE